MSQDNGGQLAQRIAEVEKLERSTAIAVAELGVQLRNVSETLAEVSEKLGALDDEGKFNLRRWFRDNWPAIVAGVAAVAAIAK